MKSLISSLASLILLTGVGCCSLHRCGGASDLCGGGASCASKPCFLKKWLDEHHSKCKGSKGCQCGCHAAPDCAVPATCGCGAPTNCAVPAHCGAPAGCGAPMASPGCSAPVMPAPANCGCGQPHALTPYESPSSQGVVPVPGLDAAPTPLPGATNPERNSVPPVPGTDSAPPPTTQNWQNRTVPQTVSYEEFQRLPGQILTTSATTAPSAPAALSPSPTSVPQPVPMPEATAPIIVQPGNWAPAR